MGDQMQGPPPYGPQPGYTNVTVVPGAIIVKSVGPEPTHTTCSSCGQETVTRITRKASTKTHIFAAVLCIFACWPCVFIPYCMDSCLSVDHYCSNCGAYVGTYKN